LIIEKDLEEASIICYSRRSQTSITQSLSKRDK